MLIDYYLRAYKYPVICHESLLFLYHLIRKDPKGIVEDFKKYNKFGDVIETDWTTEPTYNAILNFLILIFMDIAAIASVSNLIIVPGDPGYMTLFKALPFLGLILLDIASEVVILVYHDIPLCNQEDEKILHHNFKFQVARVTQIFVMLCWIGALVWMVIEVKNLKCTEECTCTIYNLDLNCSSPLCPVNTCTTSYCQYNQEGVCQFNSTDNSTTIIGLPPERSSFQSNCTQDEIQTIIYCQQTHPSLISCILLGLILVENLYQTIGIFFKSYLMPITLPDFIMFQLYLMTDNVDGLINRFGKSEFGFHWNTQLLENLIDEGL